MTLFSRRIDPMLQQEIFQTPFSNNNNNEKKRETSRPVTQVRKEVVLSRTFIRMVPVDYSYTQRGSI